MSKVKEQRSLRVFVGQGFLNLHHIYNREISFKNTFKILMSQYYYIQIF